VNCCPLSASSAMTALSTYDANGNTLSDPSGKSFTWDFENRLTQVVNPGVGTTTFRYDPFGSRIQKSGPLGTTNYLYDGPMDGAPRLRMPRSAEHVFPSAPF
jgi:YD repeat-containing protein